MSSTIKVNTVIPQCGNTLTVGGGLTNVVTSGNLTVTGDASASAISATNTIRAGAFQASDGGNIIAQTGTTITLGASGDNIVLASGATQSGFGRTGTVNWSTTPVTATPTTGVNGVGYFINASGGAKTVNLPASPSAGDIMAVSDYSKISETNNITIGRNGSNIQGAASDLIMANNGIAFTLVFVDATKGWIVTDSGVDSDREPAPTFICASSPSVATVGDYKIHTFTGPGTFTVNSVGNAAGSNSVDYLVLAGGGGSGVTGGGGGAGGYRESSGATSGGYSASPLGACVSALPVSVQSYSITIGGGGTGGAQTPQPARPGTSGSPSTFSSITSTGGGGGDGYGAGGAGSPGGSGGGGAAGSPGGTGNTPPVSPAQGFNGANGGADAAPGYSSGGGGGATSIGISGSPPSGGGVGGNGATTSINNSSTVRGGGGGGGSWDSKAGGAGGPGGGGAGGAAGANPGTAGTTNKGGGGGGPTSADTGNIGPAGVNGGSGIVIIRYKFQ